MLQYDNPALLLESEKIESGEISWRSPSNLAIVKYWGKYDRQLPRNPSISLTLSKAYTEMRLSYQVRKEVHSRADIALEFTFEGEEHQPFASKIKSYLEGLLPIFPFLQQLQLKISSHNSFPHSSGIASSASAMSALALCLCSLEDRLFGTLSDDGDFDQKASYISRLGSGSACRSIYPSWAVWGSTSDVPESSDLYAVPAGDQVHSVFNGIRDSILIVSTQKKSVSSSQGHRLMEEHTYANARYEQARRRLQELLGALRTGNWEVFGRIAENEALSLHGLMMTSQASYLLLHPNTLYILNAVRKYRRTSGNPVYFSLDAGPNVHLLYPPSVEDDVRTWIQEELLRYCVNGKVIHDQLGEGPEEL